MKVYYIYHIAGIKIGCTSDLIKRMSDQGFTEWEILEEHTDIYEVSDREIELQKQYGLPVDKVPYWKNVENRPNGMSKETVIKSQRVKELNNTLGCGGLIGGKVKSKWLRKLTFEQAEEIRSKYIPIKYSMYKLAKEYNVTVTTIFHIIKNNIYAGA